MKYMLEYKIGAAGLTHDQNFAGSEGLLNAFGKWKPEDGLTVHAFVSNLAGNGGYWSCIIQIDRGTACSTYRPHR